MTAPARIATLQALAARHARTIDVLSICGLAGVVAAAAWRIIHGSLLHDRPRLLVALYVVLAYLVFVSWLWARLRQRRPWTVGGLGVDAAVVLLSASRVLTSALPVSGHVLLFVYTGLATPSRPYRAVAVVALGLTLVMKVFYWHDLGSPAAAALVAAAFYAAHRRLVDRGTR